MSYIHFGVGPMGVTVDGSKPLFSVIW